MFGDSLSTVRDEMNESFEMASYIFPYFWLKCKEIYNIDIVTSDKGKVELTAERRKGNHNQIHHHQQPILGDDFFPEKFCRQFIIHFIF